MAASFGVHFGATSACIAVSRDGKVDVVANDAGDRTTPSVVAFTDHDQTVGLAAKQGIIRNASNTVVGVKKVLGRNFDDPVVQETKAKSPVSIISKDGKPRYEVDYKEKTVTFSPSDIARDIYKKMMETAESAGGLAESHDAVITVPLEYTEDQIKAAHESATNAGFNVLRVIHEPVAAALAYDIGQNDINEMFNVLVYRIGGTSLDATILTVNSGMYKVVATQHDSSIGGCEIDDILVKHFAGEFKRQWKADCLENKRSVMKLKIACQNCKHVLSTMASAHCSVDSLYDGLDFNTNLSRGRFEGLCTPFFQKCLQPLTDVLKSANLSVEEIDKVILCGGTAKIPQLQQNLKQYFSSAEIFTRLVPDEVIAIGAANQAAILCGADESEITQHEGSTELPCLSADILIETGIEAEPFKVVLPQCTPIPSRRQHKFVLQPEQTSLCLNIFQRMRGDAPQRIAKCVLRDLPAGSQITTVFHLRSDGTLHVTCTEQTSNKSTDVTIETS